VGLQPEFPASEWPQTHALDRVATGIGKIFFCSPKYPDRLWGPPSGYRRSFPGVKRARPGGNHSPPSSAVVKNERSCTSFHRIRLHDLDKNKYTFCHLCASKHLSTHKLQRVKVKAVLYYAKQALREGRGVTLPTL
jgi:hypothetical protein